VIDELARERAETWKGLLERYDVTVEWVAQQAGVSSPRLASWICGSGQPKDEWANYIDEAFVHARLTQPLRLAARLLEQLAKLDRRGKLLVLNECANIRAFVESGEGE